MLGGDAVDGRDDRVDALLGLRVVAEDLEGHEGRAAVLGDLVVGVLRRVGRLDVADVVLLGDGGDDVVDGLADRGIVDRAALPGLDEDGSSASLGKASFSALSARPDSPT